jgi:hypothetical protein
LEAEIKKDCVLTVKIYEKSYIEGLNKQEQPEKPWCGVRSGAATDLVLSRVSEKIVALRAEHCA